MWEVIRTIIQWLCFILMTFFYGIPMEFVGIMEILDKDSSTREGIFFIILGTLILVMSIGSMINFYFF